MDKIISCVAPLFVPATRADRFQKAAGSGTDAVIVDLEDTVAISEKTQGRAALSKDVLPSGPIIMRINSATTEWFEGDVDCARKMGVKCLMLPKTETADDVLRLRNLASDAVIFAIIETAKGMANARAIASSGVARLVFGSLDYCVDLSCAHEHEVLASARSELVLASRLTGIVAPLDGVTTAIDDETVLESDARRAHAFGFGGKMCIHRSQVESVKREFTPSPSEISWAHSVLAESEKGVAKVGGKMVDAPVILRARQILSRLK